ncbi:MAG: GLPGLI family protein [Bacteroidales bacterium]
MKHKRMLSLGLGLTVLLSLSGQDNGILLTGSVIYRQTDKLDIQFEGDGGALGASLPKERTSEKILHFSPEASLYEGRQTGDEGPALGSAQVMIHIEEPEHRIYTDLQTGDRIEQREFMSRTFLIESRVPDEPWKMNGEQRTILDYPCMGAEREVDGRTVKAWFTPSLALPAGPDGFGNLPGLILALEVDGGQRVLEALEVILEPLAAGVLEKPGKGKKMSREEFQAMVREKMEEMGSEGEGGEHIMVVRITR